MDSSRRAVESYWRSRMIDGATSDEDKVTPVYKLEEICELLRSSHGSIVKEVSDFVLKRLDHKSPIVKQKALRLIKYAVGKSGVDFRREMQRHSAAVRQLFHYKGQVDPLKGDSLNKAVRDTAQETIAAIFASEENKPSPLEDLNRRIEGFGNTNYVMPSEDKKSFISEVVGLGSASIKHGLNSIAGAHSVRKNENGNYKGPILRRSLTTEMDNQDKYERASHHHGETHGSTSISKGSVGSGNWGQSSRGNVSEMINGDSSSSNTGSKSREERLLETIVTSGGVRLQPTRDALHIFLIEASKCDAVSLSRAIESKLQSQLWQVRMKAVCVLESILRKKDETQFSIVASYFDENIEAVVGCSESPQSSLREKANKVLVLLDGEHSTGVNSIPDKASTVSAQIAAVQMPDLIDTGDLDEFYTTERFSQKQTDISVENLTMPATPVVDDLFGDSLITDHKNEEDPFAGVSFHTTVEKETVDDLFSGLTVDDDHSHNKTPMEANNVRPELLDIFGPDSGLMEPTSYGKDLNELMSVKSPEKMQQEIFEPAPLVNTQLSNDVPNDNLNNIFNPQTVGMNPNMMFPLGPVQYNIPPNVMYNQAFTSQPINYAAMGNFLAQQQQLLATMSNFQPMGSLGPQGNAGFVNVVGSSNGGSYNSALPDIFHPGNPVQTQNMTVNNSKKEDTRAFDFISDHLSAARDPKRVI
ncbi:hypothetical protein GIB67_018679 [Kingdonia uniflora]|uniref:VHS domain-containing protein n=1 Tax=Kingdonia uniflora TaxID=39325 RepID=A0A7J7LT23_9MAGN|nr:hypothetical protein GIB67_018679 [Kingdonia uniflora]